MSPMFWDISYIRLKESFGEYKLRSLRGRMWATCRIKNDVVVTIKFKVLLTENPAICVFEFTTETRYTFRYHSVRGLSVHSFLIFDVIIHNYYYAANNFKISFDILFCTLSFLPLALDVLTRLVMHSNERKKRRRNWQMCLRVEKKFEHNE